MENLSAAAETRFYLLKENKFNVESARKCWDFVCNEDCKIAADADAQKDTRLADGIYLIDAFGNATVFAGDNTATHNETKYIGIIQGNHGVAVALHDAADGEYVTLTNAQDNGGGNYIKNHAKAVQDWCGVANTVHLKAIGLNPDIKLEDSEYIPTLAELYLICLNREALNDALSYVGGDEIDADWYWTSTVYSATNAWGLYLYDGYAYHNTKAASKGRVRPVSAFSPFYYMS